MTNKFTIQLVIVFLGLFAFAGLIGTIWLVHDGTAGSDLAIISTPTGVALGALGSMLAHTSSDDEPPAPQMGGAPK